MSSDLFFNLPVDDSSQLRKGVAAGIVGGLAEIAVVALNEAAGGASIGQVGRQVAEAVGFVGATAWLGLAVHMVLATALGVALLAARRWAVRHGALSLSLYPGMLVALGAVWAVNFFVVLPVVSPAFVTVLPYSVSLVSKLMFGAAAAATSQLLSRRPRQIASGNIERASWS
jgi:hypothetical protein